MHTYFKTGRGLVRAVNGVSFDLTVGSSIGIVGESGSGKSVTSLSIMRLVYPPGYVAEGSITFKGRDLTKLPERAMQDIRGREIGLVFQDPMTALNPGVPRRQPGRRGASQASEDGPAHRYGARRRDFRLVGIPAPERRMHDYPDNLSGGMRQRVVIAMALANEPDLLILDEPTTAVDATVQAQILDLIADVRTRVNASVLLITHDIGVVTQCVPRFSSCTAARSWSGETRHRSSPSRSILTPLGCWARCRRQSLRDSA